MQAQSNSAELRGFNRKKTWFITGASRGFGRIWTEAALQRGDKVTTTARRLEDIVDFKERFGDAVLPMALDVTNAEQVSRVIQQAFQHFGRLDVLVNNAGTSLFAATEEASDEQSAGNIRKQFLNRLEKQTIGSPGSKDGCAVFFRADACFKLDFY